MKFVSLIILFIFSFNIKEDDAATTVSLDLVKESGRFPASVKNFKSKRELIESSFLKSKKKAKYQVQLMGPPGHALKMGTRSKRFFLVGNSSLISNSDVSKGDQVLKRFNGHTLVRGKKSKKLSRIKGALFDQKRNDIFLLENRVFINLVDSTLKKSILREFNLKEIKSFRDGKIVVASIDDFSLSKMESLLEFLKSDSRIKSVKSGIIDRKYEVK